MEPEESDVTPHVPGECLQFKAGHANWSARITRDGRKTNESFSVANFGFRRAYDLAVRARNEEKIFEARLQAARAAGGDPTPIMAERDSARKLRRKTD